MGHEFLKRRWRFPVYLALCVFAFLVLMRSPAGAVAYFIEAGQHDSSPGLGVREMAFSGEKMNISFAFDDSAEYTFTGEAASDQSDVNKLYGLSDCWNHHLNDSARLGWRWFNERLEILAFTHKNGEFSSEFLGVAELNRPYTGSIELSPDKTKYIYTFNGIQVEMERGCQNDSMNGYHLTPYFGGNQVAPHDITVRADFALAYGPVILSPAFPNPSGEPYFRTIAKALEDISLSFQVFDAIGQLVHESERVFLYKNQEKTIETRLPSGLASGFYIIRAQTHTQSGQTQLVLMQDAKADYIKWVLAK